MSGNEVRLANGQLWTAQQFLDHYLEPSASGIPGPPAPVPVDMSWCMGQGPGRYYHPGMFPIIDRLVARHDLAPGTYNLLDFVPSKKDPSLTAGISHYTRTCLLRIITRARSYSETKAQGFPARSLSIRTVPRHSKELKFDR